MMGQGFVSKDAGYSWQEVTSSIGSAHWSGVAISQEGSMIVISGDNRNIYISKDYGDTWTESSSGKYGWLNVNMDKYSNIFAVSGGRMYISNDKGLTWTIEEVPFYDAKNVALSATGVVLASFRQNNEVAVFNTTVQPILIDDGKEKDNIPQVVDVVDDSEDSQEDNKGVEVGPYDNLSQAQMDQLYNNLLNIITELNKRNKENIKVESPFANGPDTSVAKIVQDTNKNIVVPVSKPEPVRVPNPFAIKPDTSVVVENKVTNDNSVSNKLVISNETLNNITNPSSSNIVVAPTTLSISLPVTGTAVEANNDNKKDLVVKFNTNKTGEHKIQLISVSTGAVTNIGSVNVGTPGDMNYVRTLKLSDVAYGFYKVRVCYACDGASRTYKDSQSFVFRSGTPAVGYNLNTNLNFTKESAEVDINTDGFGNKIVTSVFKGKVKALGADLQIPTYAGDVYYDTYINDSKTSTFNNMMWSSLAKSSDSSINYDTNDLQKVNGRFVLPNNAEIGFTFRTSANLGNYIPEGASVKIVLRTFRNDSRYFTENWFAETKLISRFRDKLLQFASVILAPWR